MKKYLMAAASGALCLASVQPAFAAFNLKVTEIWPGNAAAPNATGDWFEVTNTGDTAWVQATNGTIYFDDDSQDPTIAVPLTGITSINPGQSVVFVDGAAATGGVAGFNSFWGSVVSPLPPVGSHTGPGLGTTNAGDAVALWVSVGQPTIGTPAHTVAAYPDPTGFPGASYDVRLHAFSTVGNAANAVSKNSVPPPLDSSTASPGDATFTPTTGVALRITELWPGNNVNPDSTADWFEVTNIGNTAWVASTNGNLYVDDSSANPTLAVLTSGVSTILPGESAIFLEGTTTPDGTAAAVAKFRAFWEPQVGPLKVGTYSGSGLGLSLNGDGVNLWQSFSAPVAGDVPLLTENFPNANTFPGQSYDTSLSPKAFSVAGNSSGAITIPRQSLPPEPTIASPGRVSAASVPFAGWLAGPPLLVLAAMLRRRRARA